MRKFLKSLKVKPNGTSLKIVLGAGVICFALFFFLAKPTSSGLLEAQKKRDDKAASVATLDRELQSYSSGKNFTPEQTAAVEDPVNRLLPLGNAKDASPGTVAKQVEQAANSNGLRTMSTDFPTRYAAHSGEIMRADLTTTVAGPLSGITAWLSEISKFEQLLTVSTSGVKSASGGFEMTVTVSVWATSAPSLSPNAAPVSPPADGG